MCTWRLFDNGLSEFTSRVRRSSQLPTSRRFFKESRKRSNLQKNQPHKQNHSKSQLHLTSITSLLLLTMAPVCPA